MLLSFILMSSESFAQDGKPDLVINDIAGSWRIEVIGRPDDPFKGTASIPPAKGKIVLAETITEDKCCNGQNHARVRQESRITISKTGTIKVTSEIKEYLLKIEGTPARYYPDNFLLRWQDPDTLVGTANSSTRVRWVRQRLNLS